MKPITRTCGWIAITLLLTSMSACGDDERSTSSSSSSGSSSGSGGTSGAGGSGSSLCPGNAAASWQGEIAVGAGECFPDGTLFEVTAEADSCALTVSIPGLDTLCGYRIEDPNASSARYCGGSGDVDLTAWTWEWGGCDGSTPGIYGRCSTSGTGDPGDDVVVQCFDSNDQRVCTQTIESRNAC